MDKKFNIDNAYLKLNHLSLLKLTGEDALSFINSQFTNDITQLKNQQWQLNGFCNPKGRLIATVRVLSSDDILYLLINNSIRDLFLERLKIFVLRAKVHFEIVDNLSFYAYVGEHQNTLFAGKLDLQKEVNWQVRNIDGDLIVNLSSEFNRFLVITEKNLDDEIPQLVDNEDAQKYWRFADIQQNVAEIFKQTSEKFIPQHVNFEQSQGLSFIKGCYPGQEVIARVHYLGKSKQTMQKIEHVSDSMLSPGEVINTDNQARLTIVDAISFNGKDYICLASGKF